MMDGDTLWWFVLRFLSTVRTSFPSNVSVFKQVPTQLNYPLKWLELPIHFRTISTSLLQLLIVPVNWFQGSNKLEEEHTSDKRIRLALLRVPDELRHYTSWQRVLDEAELESDRELSLKTRFWPTNVQEPWHRSPKQPVNSRRRYPWLVLEHWRVSL